MRPAVRRIVIVAGVLGVIVAAGVVVVMTGPDVDRFRMRAESMLPTVERGERVLVNRSAYDDAEPARGDLVLLHPPAGFLTVECGTPVAENEICPRPKGGPAPGVFILERVVAGPADRLRLRDGRAVVNGEALDEAYVRPCGGGSGCDYPGEITIPRDHYFVMGDNRGASDDSRFWGPVRREWVQGRVEECAVLNVGCSPRE